MDKELGELVERLKPAFKDNLVSVVLYGSAAMDDSTDDSSDLNVLCALNTISPQELARAEPVMRWWRDRKNPPPLLMTAEEVKTSTDCFPMEFQDMREHRRILFGPDLIENLVIDRSFYRAQVEHELRAKNIRLRQKAAELLSDPRRLTRLLTDSISTFCVLGRHALVLSGNPSRWKKDEVVAALEEVLKKRLDGCNAILTIRANNKPAPAATVLSILSEYLSEMDQLVRFVDALEK